MVTRVSDTSCGLDIRTGIIGLSADRQRLRQGLVDNEDRLGGKAAPTDRTPMQTARRGAAALGAPLLGG
jgi:hypothetical protein